MAAIDPEVKRIPKAELHCHLEGVIGPEILRRMMEKGYEPPFDADAFFASYPIGSMEEFIRWFELTDPMEGDLETFHPVLSEYVERLKQENVVYAEIMLGGSEIPKDRSLLIPKFKEFRAFVDSIEAGVIQIEFLGAFCRGRDPERRKDLIERLIILAEEGLIRGVALAGLEKGFPVGPYRPLFAMLKNAGVKIEIHAGEWCGPESITEALENGFPDRLGHCTSLFQDPELVVKFKREQIHIEMCPTSNSRTGSIKNLADHPLRKALDLELNFSINSDDPGAFECTPGSEYGLASQKFGFSRDDLLRVTRNALNSRFCPHLKFDNARDIIVKRNE